MQFNSISSNSERTTEIVLWAENVISTSFHDVFIFTIHWWCWGRMQSSVLCAHTYQSFDFFNNKKNEREKLWNNIKRWERGKVEIVKFICSMQWNDFYGKFSPLCLLWCSVNARWLCTTRSSLLFACLVFDCDGNVRMRTRRDGIFLIKMLRAHEWM